MRIPWEKAANLLLVHVSGCEWPMAKQTLINASRQFYELSGAYRVDCSPLVTTQGIGEYDVLDEPHVTVFGLRDVYVGHRRIDDENVLTPARFLQFSKARGGTGGSPEMCAWFNDALNLFPVPTLTGEEIQATLLVKPDTDSVGLPKELWDQHIDYLVWGARAELHASFNKPYSSPVDAAVNMSRFTEAANTERVRIETGGADVRLRTRPRFF